MATLKEYNELEKQLMKKLNRGKENIIKLDDEDFKDGKLTVFGYDRLKQQGEYIPYKEKIEIIVPQEYGENFKDSLDYMGARELAYLRRCSMEARIATIILLAFGILWISLRLLLDTSSLIEEIVMIASWVFVWAAIEKWFFGRRRLREQRFSLLQILSAQISTK